MNPQSARSQPVNETLTNLVCVFLADDGVSRSLTVLASFCARIARTRVLDGTHEETFQDV